MWLRSASPIWSSSMDRKSCDALAPVEPCIYAQPPLFPSTAAMLATRTCGADAKAVLNVYA